MSRGACVLLVFVSLALVYFQVFKAINRISESLLPDKFSSVSSLFTATRSYSLGSSDSTAGRYIPCTANCSWETYTNNSAFDADFREPFDIDDDCQVTNMSDQLACVPSTFGYSREKGALVFPPVDIPRCDSYPVKEPRPTITFDPEKREFTMQCPEGTRGRYVLQPREFPETSQYKPRELEGHWHIEDYDKPVANVHGEFVYGSCGKEFTNAVLLPRFRPEVFKRAKEVIDKKTAGRRFRPMVVLFLAVDSFSRRHFYRKMPKTVDYLSKLNAERLFSVFDFKVHNVVAKHSPENMVPMFVNKSISQKSDIPDEETTGKFSLWQIAKSLGYVTNIGFESCGSNFINFLGRKLTVDHHVSTFFCAAEALIQSSLAKDASERKCIGPHWAHYHLLNYTHTFTRLYQGINQFMYVHLEAAHESSGQYAATLDDDLLEFLERYLEEFGEENDIVLMIQGDHGMRFGDWHKNIEADQELKLPIMYFIAQTVLLQRLPYSLDSLWHNSFRLVSKRDFRATILSLFTVPFNEEFPVHEETYLSQAYILHREKIKDSRVCKEANIDPWYCSCLEVTEEVPLSLLNTYGQSNIEKLLLEIIDETIRLINEKVVTTKNLPAGVICQHLTFDQIIRAYGFSITSKLEQIKVEFGVNELPSARIETIAIIGTDDKNALFDRSRDWYPIDPYVYTGYPAEVRVRTI